MQKIRIMMSFIFLFIVAVLLQIGVNVVLKNPLEPAHASMVPALVIETGESSFNPSGGDYEWHQGKSGGGVDAPHPLSLSRPTLHLKTSAETAKLHFETTPAYVEILCWDQSDFGKIEAVGTVVEITDMEFSLARGTKLYLITAEWDGIPGGTVEYFFHVKRT